jgi:kinesin family protein 18/19
MLGHEEERGIMFLTLEELFSKISSYSSERDYKIKLWYLEIYNENIKDLLSPNDETCDLREDPQKGTVVSNITELNVSSSKDIIHLLRKGNKNRTQEATNANETSSRSHAILQVLVEYKDKVTGIDAEIKIGKLSLIDLAGSERAKDTLNKGIRLIEGGNINRSLLTLGNCINALCEANEKGTKPYIPYRDSKLTRLLKVNTNLLIA